MNNKRRSAIEKLEGELDDLRDALERLRDEEQDVYDNLPASIQDGEQGEKAQAAIDSLDEAISSLEQAAESMEEAAGGDL